ncbi:MAG: diguanylate cyclase [Spirochaetia bacterium]
MKVYGRILTAAVFLIMVISSVNGAENDETGWYFIPNTLLKEAPEDRGIPVKFPHFWNFRSGVKYGTYHTKVNTNDIKNPVLQLPYIYTAAEIYINGSFAESSGITGASRQQTEPRWDLLTIKLPEGTDTEIVIRVSGFHHFRGGISAPPVITTEDAARQNENWKAAAGAFLSGCFFIIALYHLGLYLYRKADYAPLLFSMFSLLISARALLSGQFYFPVLLTSYNWFFFTRIEYLTLSFGLPTFAFFAYKLFPAEIKKAVLYGLLIISGVYTAVIIFLPVYLFSRLLPFYSLLIAAYSLYFLYALIRAALKKRPGAVTGLTGYAIFALTVLHDILMSLTVINSVPLVPVGLIFFVFFEALMISSRHAWAYKEIKILLKEKNELQGINTTLKDLTYIDPLTQISNRRHFDTYFSLEWNRGLRNRKPLGLIMIDIDSFKLYNDNYGHQAGDEALKKVAAAINSALSRRGDFVARYGGEEFVVILPDAQLEGTMLVAEKIRAEIQKLNIPHQYSVCAPVVTASLGVAVSDPQKPQQQRDKELLLMEADRSLYRAKQQGRNRVNW